MRGDNSLVRTDLFHDPESAQLIVWFKAPPLPGTPPLTSLISTYGLQPVADDELAWLFRNPRALRLAQPPRAVIPLGIAFVLLCGVIGLILWDFLRGLNLGDVWATR